MTFLGKKKILLTFARSFLALHLARELKSSGHMIYTADSMGYHVSFFSNAVTKNFRVPSPRYHQDEYIQALIEIVKKEKIDLIIPIYEEISYLSKVRHLFPSSCELFFPEFENYDELHNKWKFQCKLEALDFDVLDKKLIRSGEEAKQFSFDKPFALKACYSRASQKVRKIGVNESLPHLDFQEHNPWIAQEWLEGERFCSYSICHQGNVHANVVYPVTYAIDGNSCITFESVDHPPIFEWIASFVKKTRFTGQIAFDFIISKANKIYAIECNPRATSGILLLGKDDGLDLALFKNNKQTIHPKENTRRQIAFGMLLYGWKSSSIPNNRLSRYLYDLMRTKDVVFSAKDLKPFLFEPFIFANILLQSRKYRISLPDAFIHDHEWNGEPIRLR